jgi:hypothetical protein
VLAARPFPTSVTTVPTIPWLTLSEKVEVTVNAAVGAKAPWVIDIVFEPTGEEGTWVSQTMPPVALVEDVQSAVVLSQLTVAEVVPANPSPVIVTAVPTGPVVGFTVTDGLTVKGAFAELVDSAAMTVCVPAVDSGTSNVQVRSPRLSVLEPVQTTGLASQVTVNSARPSKPVPVTVTEAPTVPVEMERVTWGSTVNRAVAVFVPSLAFNVWEPATEAGMVKAQLKAPAALEVSDPEVQVVIGVAE